MADITSSDEDIFKSRECVRLVLENLPVMLEDPRNIEARQATLLAAHYGGNAINTQLAGYVHAFAHSIGGLYHIPHGKAIAWCLVPILLAQQDLCQDQVAVAEEVADEFLRELEAEYKRQIGENPQFNPDYPKLITDAVYEKCERLTADYRDRVVFGGMGDKENRRFAPTVIYPVGADEDIACRCENIPIPARPEQ